MAGWQVVSFPGLGVGPMVVGWLAVAHVKNGGGSGGEGPEDQWQKKALAKVQIPNALISDGTGELAVSACEASNRRCYLPVPR